ncbi:MAG: hypothetical protein HC836_45585 [Richelia sp. RM2_1_2]|nr:hypothetical protein [Richelia sp. RM2_1_2]
MSGNYKNRNRITKLIIEGHSNAVIASKLNVMESLVKYHVTKILKANNVSSRAQLIAKNSESYNLKLMRDKISNLTKELELCRLELNNAKAKLYSVSLPMGIK